MPAVCYGGGGGAASHFAVFSPFLVMHKHPRNYANTLPTVAQMGAICHEMTTASMIYSSNFCSDCELWKS